MDALPEDIVLQIAVALGVGMLIGVERERKKGQGPGREPAGLRTFTLISLFGAMSLLLADALGLVAAAAIVGVLTAVSYRRTHDEDPGLTTEIAMLVTLLLGGLAMRQPALAAALGVIVTIILAARTHLHDWVHNVLTDREIADGLMLAAAALVILPLIPEQPVDPWGLVQPRKLWMLAVLIMAINGLGYITLRVLGPRIGLALAGLFSGFVSSTATIAAMAARSRLHPELRRGAVAGAAASSVATVAQLAVVVALVSWPTLQQLMVPLIASGVAAIAYAGLFTWHSVRETPQEGSPAGRPFDWKTAIVFVLIVGATLAFSAALTHWLGDRGMLLATAVAGFSDAHAPAISAASLAASGQTSAQWASIAILLGFTTNAISKTVVAFTLGDRGYAFALLPGLILMVAAAWLGLLFTRGG